MSEGTVPTTMAPASGGGLDVVYVLSLMQVAFLVLAASGEVVLMGGNPAYLFMPVVKSALLIVFATHALRRRRWALRALVVLAWLTLLGFGLQGLIGLAPVVDVTVNLVGLMTNVALPVAVIWLCRPHLREIRQARRAAKAAAVRVLAVPQDPYRPAQPTVPFGQPYPGTPVPYGSPVTPGVAVVYPPVVHGPPIPSEARAAGSTTWEAPR